MIAKSNETTPARFEPAEVGDQPALGRKQLPLMQVIWRRRWTVALITVACVAAAGIYLVKATPLYTSSSRVFVDQAGPKLLTPDSEAGLVKSDSYLYTQAQVLSSTPILSSAIAKMDVAHMKTFRSAVANGAVDNPLILLSKELKVDVGKKDDLITVSMDSESPQEAAEIVNRVVDAYIAFSSGVKRKSAAEVLDVLARERDKTEKDMSVKLAAMMEFKRENGALSFQSKDGNIILERLAALQQSLTQCELDAAEAQAEYQVGQSLMADPAAIGRYVDAQQSKGRDSVDEEYGSMKEELHKYQIGLSQAQLTRGDGSDLVRAYRDAIAKLKVEVADREKRFAEAHLAELDQRRQAAEIKEASVRRAFEDQKRAALDLNAKATEYAQLEEEFNRLQDSSKLLDSRIKDTNVTEDAGALNIQVLEVGRPGDKPTQPRKSMTLAVSLLVGLMLGTGAGLSQEWMDRKLRTPDEVVNALGLPVLGVVPHMKGRSTYVLRGQNVHRDSMSEVAEAYRTVRTAVQFGTRTAEDIKTVLVTSPTAGDGKSTSASNLAIAFAQAGYRTLLIDCDLRKPSQHKIFELAGETGLTSVVAGQAKLSECIRKTETPRLEVLPCGPIPSNPSELLNGKRFSRVMAALVAAYDKVVIDSPPVAPVTDARILAASADVTVLVVRADKTTDRQGALAVDNLRSVGAIMLGVVMNDMPRRKDAYGYYSGYYYYGRDARGNRATVVATDVTADFESMPESNLELTREPERRQLAPTNGVAHKDGEGQV